MASSNYLAVRDDWLALRREGVIDPELRIVDAHHHFYDRSGWTYLADDYVGDAGTGHNVVATVYMQAQTRYRSEGADALRPVGETEAVIGMTKGRAENGPELAKGIVGHANLRLGSAVCTVLEAHIQAGQGRFKGVRHLSTWDADASLTNPLSAVPPGVLLDPMYQHGAEQLAKYQLSYDAWLFFHQLFELAELAKKMPDTPVIVNHCGGVVRIGDYSDMRSQVHSTWLRGMRELAALPNVFVKLGGLGMRINGFEFEKGELPPSSEQLVQTWKPWMEPCIELFGADRCMFESNFPVDKGSYSYATCWNAFKRMTSGASTDELHALFEDTATRVYRLS